MTFGLTNDPSTPMRLIYNVFEKYMRKHVVVYIDDIIIYLKILLEHVEYVKLVLITHRKEKLNFNKCSFCMEKVHYLGFIVGKSRIALDRKKVKVIMDLPTPKSARKVWSFHELTNFYKRFMNDFRTITKLLNDLVKTKVVFKRGEMQENAFNLLRKKLSNASLFVLHSFYKTFEIEGDVCGLVISIVLIQDGKSLMYFDEKLNRATLKYPTYDKELFVVHILHVSQHYLWPREFVIHFDHENFKYVKGQSKLNRRHAMWVKFILNISVCHQYKQGKDNKVVHVLYKRYDLFTSLTAKILGFEHITELYRDDQDFRTIYASCLAKEAVDDYYVFHKFLIKKSMLSIPKCSIKDLFFREAYGGALLDILGLIKFIRCCINTSVGRR